LSGQEVEFSMKRNISAAALAAFLGLIGTAVPAQATSISFTDTFNPTDQYMTGKGAACTGSNTAAVDTISGANSDGCKSVTWAFSLTGYVPATDTIDSATIGLWVYNDRQSDNPEGFSLVLDGQTFTDSGPTSFDGVLSAGSIATFTYSLALTPTNPLTDASLAAVLTVSSSSENNDFYFAKSALDVAATRAESSGLSAVPEPASLFLFGTGAAVLARMKRRSKSSSTK
jgi:hypothetical protein